MKNILAIGNSFSEDATRYLHQMAEAVGIETKVVNLFIGGCPLERHWQNIETKEAAYQYQLNGKATERMISIDEALREEEWDYIVTQQASHDSGWMDTYEPFLGLILEHIRTYTGQHAPQAEILLQETWAYEIDSSHVNFMRYHRNQEEMYARLKKCYSAMAEKISSEVDSLRRHHSEGTAAGAVPDFGGRDFSVQGRFSHEHPIWQVPAGLRLDENPAFRSGIGESLCA